MTFKRACVFYCVFDDCCYRWQGVISSGLPEYYYVIYDPDIQQRRKLCDKSRDTSYVTQEVLHLQKRCVLCLNCTGGEREVLLDDLLKRTLPVIEGHR